MERVVVVVATLQIKSRGRYDEDKVDRMYSLVIGEGTLYKETL